jgi:thiosulfate/3-mercaptopyruvate sulfurtransferase
MGYKLSTLTDYIIQPEVLLGQENLNRLFIDVRLGNKLEEELKNYRESHIQGAVYGQIRDVFAGEPTLHTGNLPLPRLDKLESELKSWGVDQDTEIILYGPSMALAARGWWILRWAGLSNVKVLDGGLRAWINQGGAVAQGDFVPTRRATSENLKLKTGQLPEIHVSEVMTLLPDVILIDARDESSYLAGCIPRARNLPSSEQWTPAMNLRTIDEIRQLYKDVGVRKDSDVVVYCGGGVLSAFSVLTLSALGIVPRLFVGSWSEWNKDPKRMAMSTSERIVF